MNSSPHNLITFCCLGYNHAKYLKENLDSISRIDYDAIEVIVVDDGSKDNSVELLHELKASFPYPLTIIAQSNTGNIGGNFNRAIRQAKGQLISFIALDDVFNAHVVLSEISQMNDNPNLGFIASTKAIYIDDQGIINTEHPDIPTHLKDNLTLDDLLEAEYSHFGGFYLQGSVLRKEIIDAIGGFDEDMTGDDLILRTKVFLYMQKHPEWSFKMIKENNVFYRIHATNVHKNMGRQVKIVTEYLERYWPDRPNPDTLIEWMLVIISLQPFEEYFVIFTTNMRSASLLKEKKIQERIRKAMIKTIEKKVTFFQRFIFNKQKVNNKKQITLLGFISFTCHRKNTKPSKQSADGAIHYSQYQ